MTTPLTEKQAKKIVKEHGKDWGDLLNRHFTPREIKDRILYELCGKELRAISVVLRYRHKPRITRANLVGNVVI